MRTVTGWLRVRNTVYRYPERSTDMMPPPRTGNTLSDEIMLFIFSKTNHTPSIYEAIAIVRAHAQGYALKLGNPPPPSTEDAASLPTAEPETESSPAAPITIIPKSPPLTDPYSTYPPEERIAAEMNREAIERKDIWK